MPLFLAFALAWSSQILLAQSALFDDSNGPFTILAQAVTVLAPNGGENWKGGETHDITWSMVSSTIIARIEYSTNSGSSWTVIAADTANDGTYSWMVPNIVSSTCLVRISDGTNSATWDGSDAVFTIAAGSEAISAPSMPAGPTTWPANTSYDFSTGGSVSSAGHAVQYKFDWGDGSDSGWLTTGTTGIDHAWTFSGTYQVRTKARCVTHTTIESSWSETRSIVISAGNAPVLQWNTFLGNNDYDQAHSIAVDNSGNIFVTGNSDSTWGDPPHPHSGFINETFVAKLNASGILQWNTFLGSKYTQVNSIALDSSGNIFVIGRSAATWGSPVNLYSGNDDTFVAKLDSSGIYQWHTFLGSSYGDNGYAIALDASGNIFITGESSATWGSSPLHPLNDQIPGYGNSDIFAAKLNASGVLQWNTFMGGSYDDNGRGITLDNSGNIYIAGSSDITWYKGDAYVAKLNTNGALQWQTLMGGIDDDEVSGIALDGNGNIFVAGNSHSTWGTPLHNFSANVGNYDAFVAKLNQNGALQWHTFNDGTSGCNGIALDNSGNIFVIGVSGYSWGIPINPFSGYFDTFVVKLNASGARQWHTFVGGNSGDEGQGIAADNNGNVYVTGYSTSNWGRPLRPYSALNDAFVAKIGLSSSTLTITSPNGGENWAVGSSQNITWNSLDPIANVNIDYSTNNGSSWTPLAINAINSGTYTWTIPATPSANCLMRVRDAADGDPSDTSDAVFSIAMEIITAPTQPSGPALGLRNTSLSFSANGATSSFGHELQYRFDWGDGSDSGWLANGTISADHVWTVSGTSQVRAMARCTVHPSFESPWSAAHTIIITDNGYYNLHEFTGGAVDGKNPSGSLILSGTTFYGTTYYGGDSNNGTIFKIEMDGTGFTLLHEFAGGAADGEAPSGSLIISGSTLFGMTFIGGDNTYGTIFKIETDGTGFTILHNFIGGVNDGQCPAGSLVISGSTLYGMTIWGGDGNKGTIFKIETNGTGFALLHKFIGGAADGNGPNGSLILSGSTLYGMTRNGGNINYGTIFKIQTDGSGFALLHQFAKGTADGNLPDGSLIISGSTIYGMTKCGGLKNYGTIFKIETDGTGYILLHEFIGGAADGKYPCGSPIFSGSTIYGMSQFGGDNDLGTIFKMQTDGTGYTLLHKFVGGTADGAAPTGDLFLFDSILYGMTFAGGDSNLGVIFSLPLSADNSIIVISPNGGEDWTAGSSYSITWSLVNSINNVNIDYSTDNGSSWNPVAANIANSGSYAWTIPATPSINCLVRVSDAANAVVSDVSNAVFNISAAPTLTVTAPNGGENWISSTAQNITWSSTGAIASVNIDYSTDSGSNWNFVAANIANSGSYAWTIPATPSTNCLVRVSDAANNNATYDVSNAVFSISTVSTCSISGTITSGGTGLANVVMNGLPGNPTTNASGFYSAAVNYNWSGTATPTLAGCTFNPANKTYTNVTANQITNYTATITPSLVVTKPNSTSLWERGKTYAITWLKGGTQNANVKIMLYKGTSTLVSTIASTTPNDGAYDWLVPTTLATGSTYFIRIKTVDNLISDDSDKFSIIVPFITVTAPAAGNTWIRGTSKNITWTTQGTMNANVKIQLYKGTTKALDIITSTPTANGTFTWNIPSTLATATNYAVKVITLDNLVTGTSGTFSIVTGIITVTAPAAGAKWQRGVAHAITWTKEGTLNANVKIQLYKGTTLDSTIISTTPNNGSYNWTIPATKTLATTYKIRITTIDSLVTSYSGVFSITSTSALTLETPNGSERLAAHSAFPINWTIDPSISEVKLEYSRDNGGTFFTIADHLPNSGRYDWSVPVNFTFNGIIRVSDSLGKNWLDEEGVLECLFKFNCSSQEEARQPDLAVWFGGVNTNAPGYGFARVAISSDMIQMAEVSRAIVPLSSGWHEAKIRLDLKRDLGTLFIDNERLLENVELYTSPEHHFEPYLSIRAGGGAAQDLLLAELTVQVTLLNAEGNEKECFTIMNEDFSGYDAVHNVIDSCWQVSGQKPDGPALMLKALPGTGQALQLQSTTANPVTIVKPLAIPEKIPFDISDRSFIIEIRQRVD